MTAGASSRAAYLDASAIAKLVLTEPETDPLRRFLAGHGRWVVSRIGAIETRRAALLRGGLQDKADDVLEGLVIVELDAALAETAALLAPASLRTLDAIHLATAMELRSELAVFVTYDARLAAAARDAGLPVEAPG